MKKTVVLIVLFVLPLVVYMFFASGVTNFGRLPVLTEEVGELDGFQTEARLEGKITILCFSGSESATREGNAFNLNQKIYKPFYEFTDFQVVMVVPLGQEEFVSNLKKELGALVDIGNWEFVYGSREDIQELFESLQTDLELDATGGTPYVFIIDKDRKLRGRNADDDIGTKYGFNTSSVADLNNKMKDDVKIILAEYRLALKKNLAERQ
ncbi:hypothetical protein [Robiginitalea aurantiaca]|uniref:Uncharacterized protein n=1 Tax=Robiginitalea aurantiaca TaxID=3056915 RepID=A0ABT7WBZ6_9FLAO|nr:hypothetical protein [Robiginitalea aurantiaca]MDM9630436.1 hypothetical protein [Robiginitalea aurantiaca]